MPDIYHNAIKIGNEFAWRENDVPSIVQSLIDNSYAVVGAEVWIKTLDNKIVELYWFDFQIHDRDENEEWIDYVNSTSLEFLNSFNVFRINTRVLEEIEFHRGELYFNISFVSEDELRRLMDQLL